MNELSDDFTIFKLGDTIFTQRHFVLRGFHYLVVRQSRQVKFPNSTANLDKLRTKYTFCGLDISETGHC